MKRVGKARALYEKKLAALSAEDQAEVSAFGRFLEDKAVLSPLEMVNKHGEYMGFSTSEIAMLKSSTRG